MISWLDYLDKVKIKEVSALHYHLLPNSPIPQLGNEFMEGFYYKQLIKYNLINCLICIEKDEVIGFIVFTKFPKDFMLNGIIKSPIDLAISLIIGIFKKPARLIIIFKIILLALTRGSTSIPENTSEILSMGVKKKFRNRVIPNSGLKISHALFQKTVSYLRFEKEKYLQVLTEKDNVGAIKFYEKMKMILAHSKFYDKKKDVLFKITL